MGETAELVVLPVAGLKGEICHLQSNNADNTSPALLG